MEAIDTQENPFNVLQQRIVYYGIVKFPSNARFQNPENLFLDTQN
jgi:hypothetical protein